MVDFESIPSDTLGLLAAKQVINRALNISSSSLGGPPDTYSLNESFEVWSAYEDKIIDPGLSFADAVYNTGVWHIQIKKSSDAESEAIAYAEATPLGPGFADWDIDGVFRGQELAKKIDLVGRWIDENIKDESLVARLVVLEGYQTTVFWLINPSEGSTGKQIIVVINAPQKDALFSIPFTYSPDKFIQELCRLQHIEGIT
ncbi:MAG: hypothetical protein AAF959_16415 [Cyanobacteria bacterium P01_D01_bin.56]